MFQICRAKKERQAPFVAFLPKEKTENKKAGYDQHTNPPLDVKQ